MNDIKKILESIKNNILERISKSGISERALSLNANLSAAAVNQLLRSSNLPKLDSLVYIANALNCKLEDLLSTNPSTKTISFTKEDKIDGNEIKINDQLFVKSIAKLEELIEKKKVKFSPELKAKIILDWYELSLLIEESNEQNQTVSLQKFDTVLRMASRYPSS